MSEVVEINDIDQLEHYHLVWHSLLRQTREASFFQSLDWLRAYWQHFGNDKHLRVLIVYHAGTPLGILPLVVLKENTRIGKLRVLTYPLHDWSTFYGPVGPNPTATLVAGLRHVRQTKTDWDLLDLRWINRDGVDHGRTATAMRSVGLGCREAVWKESATIDMSTSWEDYFASRTSKFRNNIRRAIKRSEELGKLKFERHRPQGTSHGDDTANMDDFDACVEIARRSWQGQSTDGTTLSHDSVRGFFRQTHLLAARNGALDMALLRLDDQIVAFGYNYQTDGFVSGLRVGVDPDCARSGLATVLYVNMFQDGFQRGDKRFDLGPGSMTAKRFWYNEVVQSYRCTHYPLHRPRVQALRLKHWADARWPQSTTDCAS